jgi:molecular chaperone HscA
LQASFSYAAEDKLARQLAEERLSGWQLIEGLKSALAADGDALMSDEERAEITDSMNELEALLEGGDADAIHTLTERLGRQSEAFASRRMDKSVREALAGMSLDALDDEVMQ